MLLFAFSEDAITSDTKVQERSYVKIGGFLYLENIADHSILESISERCERIGYTCKLNPDADYYATNEVSGAEVFQDPDHAENVYVKRENGFVRYTLIFAQASLFVYEGELYIREEDFSVNQLSGYVEIATSKKPSKNEFVNTGRKLYLGEQNQMPRCELETNDFLLDGATVWYIPDEEDYLCVDVGGGHIYYVRAEVTVAWSVG